MKLCFSYNSNFFDNPLKLNTAGQYGEQITGDRCVRIHGCKPASLVPQNYLFHLKRCFTNYFPIYQAHKLQKQMQLPIASKLEKRSNSVPTNRNDTSHSNAKDEDEDEDDQPRNNKIMAEAASSSSSGDVNTARPSISNENNILLDPDVLDDQVTES